MAVSFDVDPVEPATAPAATISLAELVGDHVALGVPGELRVLPARGVHPLLAAVHHAFVEHRPLVLSPDAVWLTIAGGVAHHVRLNAEALRPRLVRHAGRKMLAIKSLAAPSTARDWCDAVACFRALVADDLGHGLARLFTCDFSTSGEAERVASEIVLLDATSPYYRLLFSIICGIPRITLTGTPDDWRAIRARVDVIAELGLEAWAASLAPISDRLVAAAEGHADAEFFRAIYKPREAYGRDEIAGWIARLYPYVRDDHGRFTRPNPLLALGIDDAIPEKRFHTDQGPGIITTDPPAGPAGVLVVVQAAGHAVEHQLEGGLLAVELDATGHLVPRAGWLVRPAGTGAYAVAARIAREHRAVDAAGREDPSNASPRELFAMIWEAFLFEATRPWHVLPPDAREQVLVGDADSTDHLTVQRLIDLPDGTFLGVAHVGTRSETVVVRMRGDALGTEVVVDLDRENRAWYAAQLAADPTTDPVTGLPWSELSGDDSSPELAPLDEPPRYRATTERVEEIAVIDRSLVGLLAAALDDGGLLPPPGPTRLIDLADDLWDGAYHAAPLLDRLRAAGQRVELRSGAGRWFDRVDELVIAVGDPRWRLIPRTDPRAIALRASPTNLSAERLVDLGDGTAIARTAELQPRFVQLHVADLPTVVIEPARTRVPARTALATDAPLDQISVLGRSLVEILTHALDHGTLPTPRGTLADR